MSLLKICLFLGLFATTMFPGCAGNAPTRSAADGKPAAPVQVEGNLSGGTLVLKLTINGPATSVELVAAGLGGVKLTGGSLQQNLGNVLSTSSFSRTLQYEAAEQEGSITVQVRGLFNGHMMSKVQDFVIPGTSFFNSKSSAPLQRGAEGEPLVILPAD